MLYLRGMRLLIATICASLAAPAWPAPAVKGKAKAAAATLAMEVRPEPRAIQHGHNPSLMIKWFNKLPEGGPVIRVNRRCLLGREVVIVVRPRAKPAILLVTPSGLGAPVEADFQTLAPGTSFEYEYPIMPKDGKPLAPGSYDVTVTYTNDVAFGEPPAWTGTLRSRVKVRVLPAVVQ